MSKLAALTVSALNKHTLGIAIQYTPKSPFFRTERQLTYSILRAIIIVVGDAEVGVERWLRGPVVIALHGLFVLL